jgi:hypothetical protein
MNLLDQNLVTSDSPTFAMFCDHVNIRLCTKEFLDKTRELENPKYNRDTEAILVLPIKRPAFEHLKNIPYAKLVKDVCARLEIGKHSVDSFRSELDDSLLSFYVTSIRKHRHQIRVEFDDTRPALLLAVPDLISDLILPPLSQLHSEVVENCIHFARIMSLGACVFLNARTSSVFRQFILTWLAVHMGVPLSLQNNDTTVGVS